MPNTILLKNGTVLSHDEDDKHVNVLRNTDVLIEGNTIKEVGRDLQLSEGESDVVLDCTDKIISPGFTDTHRHLWQTQLKGRHADETLLDYFSTGNIQHNNYTSEDFFWGQLAGAMESVDMGTTFVLDHAHCCVSEDAANQAISATITSGIRCLFAYMKPNLRFSKWDQEEIVPIMDFTDFALDHIEQLVRAQPLGNGRLTMGMAFDSYFLPKELVQATFSRVINTGVKVITSHIVRGGSTVAYDVLEITPNFVLSHATNISPEDRAVLARTQTAISCTPETEAQMGHGSPLLAVYPKLNISLGVDCHTNNTSFMPQIARTALFCARLTTNNILLEQDKFPRTLVGNTELAFNATTVQGARAVGMLDRFGSLKVGKAADIVVFDTTRSTGMSCVSETDPLAAVMRHSDVRDIEAVIIDGAIRKWEGKLRPVTRETIDGKIGEEMSWYYVRKNLLQSTKDIWARDEKRSEKLARDLVANIFHTDMSRIVDPELMP